MSHGTPPPPPPENPYGGGGQQPPAYGGPTDGPPVQPGGYGASAPPPPPPVPGAGHYDAVEAIKYGWAKFSKNAGPFIAAAALVLVVSGLFSFLGQTVAAGIFGTTPTTTIDPDTGAVSIEGGGFLAGLMANAVVSFVGQVITTLLFAGLLKMAFDVVDGKQAELGTMLEGWDKVQLLVAALITGVLTAIGVVLCVLPGIAVAVFTAFTTAFVVDRKLGAIDAITGSVSFVRSHLGSVIVWMLLVIVCAIVGAILCLVGLLVAIPVIAISQAYTVRVLHGQQVSPA